MGFYGWLRRGWTRRRFLNQERRTAAEHLALSPLADAAPAVAEAIRDLHEVVTAAAHEAVQAAHDSLAPSCREELRAAREQIENLIAEQGERVAQVASRCNDAVERTAGAQGEQTEQMRALRDMHSSAIEQTRRWAEGYDWQLIKEFCFRFIRILDNLEDRRKRLHPDANAELLRDLDAYYQELLFALEASGVEQFRPELRSQFAGNEKQLRADRRIESPSIADHGLVAQVCRPGYRLVRDGTADRILRPANVEVFASSAPGTTSSLQEVPS